MKRSQKKISRLLETSREVIRDAVLDNGAIVAANTDKPYYPREAANYRYVWPRDACFTAMAAETLGIPAADKFFRWLEVKPEDFHKDKLLFSNYSTNGRIGSMGRMFQPDQMGTVLWAIHRFTSGKTERALPYRNLIELTCEGLCVAWNKTFFLPNTVDIWEDGFRQTSSRIENNFTYSLAACGRGLMLANDLFPHKQWKQVATQMQKKVNEAYDSTRGYFLRNHGKIDDLNVDASILGLVWPFEAVLPTDQKMRSTIDTIEHILVVDGGVHRFQFDYFDSEGTAWEGGGAWPVLNCWLAIVLNRIRQRERALAYFSWVVDHVDRFIPEQIFPDFRVGITPLVWSHALFVLAAEELQLLETR
ncbi:MAG: glycoside hydrolase family 15 protein [Candidatus Kerfeldbacteria bacterium]